MENKEIDILLIEDNPNDAELTMRALRKKDLANNLHWIKDGEEALDFLLSENKNARLKYNLKMILLDLKLPKISGFQILKHIKNNENLKNIPVVVLTSSKEDRDLSECYSNSVNSYIVKPVDFSEFMETVSSIGIYWLNLNQSIK
ncbi:MAG: response regulator [Prolixibacteraceae bacterium]|nr:response regulator [Prolixibacteraceae bacterium]MBN2773484.1 response regulator [Prolixibacteraceae bacterium]